MIQLLICDDQEIVCQGLHTILSHDSRLQVIGIAHDGQEAIDMALQHQPDLVLMDLKMPGVNGVQATQRIHQLAPQIKVLILTTYDDDEWLFDAIRAGASGYLLKDTPAQQLIEAILGTSSGNSYVDPKIAGKLLNNVLQQRQQPRPSHIQLTERERDILQCMARGLSNADIARELYLSEGTVRNYTSAIFARLGVSDRTQAVIVALRHGLVQLDE